MLEVTILSKPECRLCKVAYRMAQRIQSEVPFMLHYRDISSDPVAMARYGDRVPVVLIEREERLCGNVTEQALRRAIKRARWRRPISRILSRFGWKRG